MENTLFLSKAVENILDSLPSESKIKLKEIDIFSNNDFNKKLVDTMNNFNKKLSVGQVAFSNTIHGINKPTKYFGVVQTMGKKNIAYVFLFPPDKANTRSGFISQQVFPNLSNIIQDTINSSSYELSNLPIYFINIDVEKLTASKAINTVSSKILNIHYVDLFDRDENELLISQGLNPNIKGIESYNELIKGNRKGTQENVYFAIDLINKSIKFKTQTLKDGIGLTNEPYYFVIKAYTALFLASKESYNINTDDFTMWINNMLSHGKNKNIESFYNYLMKVKIGGNKVIQTIYYGAPGTGKSFNIEEILLQDNVSTDYIFRTTFHPEYTYSDFVGQLLPVVSATGNITYDFIKGIFIQAVEKAYEDTSKNVYLILEEMSRGDVAAIFGDIFQLLDRERNGSMKGYSKYFINNAIIAKDIVRITDDKVKLPPNLFILGTVNTSDQNVFVMDTAFKRRFDWKYVSTKPVPEGGPYENNISFELFDSTGIQQSISWIDFYGVLNIFITNSKWLGLGEDKQVGQFFIEFEPTDSQDKHKEKIQNKLLNYLWNDIQQASYKNNIQLFSEKISSFSDLYDIFEKDEQIFSDDFLKCIELWKTNKL